MLIHLIKKTQTTLLITEKIQISAKYLDFSDIFLEKKTLILIKATELNKHAIKF